MVSIIEPLFDFGVVDSHTLSGLARRVKFKCGCVCTFRREIDEITAPFHAIYGPWERTFTKTKCDWHRHNPTRAVP